MLKKIGDCVFMDPMTVCILFMLPVILLGWIPVIGLPLGMIVGLILVIKFSGK